jgi:hypothetical protein
MTIIYTNIFHSKVIQILPNLGLLVGKLHLATLLWAFLLKITEVDQKVWATFSTEKRHVRISTKMCLATFWAIFFKNSSDHPEENATACQKAKP